MIISTETDGVTKVVMFKPGYNYLHETGPRSRGQHGMEILFVLREARTAVHFALNTMWTPLGKVDEPDPLHPRVPLSPVHPARVIADPSSITGRPYPYIYPPTGNEIGWHLATKPEDWGDQDPRPGCDWLEGNAPCYTSSSQLTDAVLEKFIEGGDDAVWTYLADMLAEAKSWSA